MKPKGQEDVMEDNVAIVEDPLSRVLLSPRRRATTTRSCGWLPSSTRCPTPAGVIRTFFIKNADVSKAAEMINSMFAKFVYIPGRRRPKTLPPSMTQVTVMPDVRSSALLGQREPREHGDHRGPAQRTRPRGSPNVQAEARFFQLQHTDRSASRTCSTSFSRECAPRRRNWPTSSRPRSCPIRRPTRW